MMKKALALLLVIGLMAGPALTVLLLSSPPSRSQVGAVFPETLPAGTVLGRLVGVPGPMEAIPFGTLFANLFGGSAPAAHSVLIGEGSSGVIAGATTGTTGRLLIDQGASADPAFQACSGDVACAGSGALTIQAGAITNSKMASGAANTIKGSTSGSSEADLTVPQAQQVLGLVRLTYPINGVNFNSGNTDNAITLTPPTGYTTYTVRAIYIYNAGASLSTATFGVFSATAGGGTAIQGSGTAITVTQAAANTNNNFQLVAITNSNTEAFNFATVYFRVGTAEGSAATGSVALQVDWLF